MRLLIRTSLIIASLLASCDSGGSAGGPASDGGVPAPGDAGGAPSDGGTPAPPATRSAIHGRRHELCRQRPADVDTSIDLSLAVVQALVPDTSPTGFTVINGIGGSDGQFTIDSVPDGTTYLLRIDNTYYATDQHTLDVRSESPVRCQPAPDTESHNPFRFDLRYTVTGLTPVVQSATVSDRIDIASLALDHHVQDFLHDNKLPDGATSATGLVCWRGSFGEPPLLDAAAGDDLQIFHLRERLLRTPVSQRQQPTTWLVDVADASGASVQPGVEATATGVAHPAPSHALTFSIDPRAMDADAGPAVQQSQMSLRATASPTALSRNAAWLFDLDLSDRSYLASPVQTVTDLVYGDPFPATWQRALHFDYAAFQSVFEPESPTGTISFIVTVATHHEQLTAFDGTVALDTTLHPPDQVTVGGIDFTTGGKLRFDGQAPVALAWQPAADATAYRVMIYALEFGTFGDPLATMWTTQTRLQLPAALFAGGLLPDGRFVTNPGFYVFVIDSVATPSEIRTGHLLADRIGFPDSIHELRLPAPVRIAGRASGRFHFVAHCGDGEVQVAEGEQCDTGGESATCNADCTFARCGDGVRNVLADEECDDAGRSRRCNDNCTLARCGDGILGVNEDCDDGNTRDDGNGCTADCHFNNVCGDGVLQDAVELCDPGPAGETATCDFDCTPTFCGDGHVNPAAGEECDVPGFDPHCAGCKIQP